ncbi:MAG TPA: hypothetical protein VG204_10265 [Terriglobia bacterium]|nr:hypothetical protein [Terriglobia bacterium]
MKRMLLYVGLVIAVCGSVAGQSSSNGVYGGYVASSAWFHTMRQSAENMAMLRQLGGGTPMQPVPADYIEVAGQFQFPQGNPFPKGRLPDLRIKCDQSSADSVERAPHITQNGNDATFYTVLRRGYAYTFQWMYYFGGKETFASWHVPANNPGQIRLTIALDPKGHGRVVAEQPTPATSSRTGRGGGRP